MRNKLCLLVLAASAVLGLAATGFAVPIEILDDPTHPLSQPVPPADGKTGAQEQAADVAATVFEFGDTVNVFCPVATFKWGDFGGTDCWGWTHPDGDAYAIMGSFDGIRFVNVSTLTDADFVPGPTSGCGGTRWRDMVTYQNYCYAVSECGGVNAGLMVMDMQYLPDSVHFVGAFELHPLGYRTSHNITIDTATGYLYAEGLGSENYSIHVLSLADPENPTHVHSFGPANGLHDLTAQNDTLYVAEGWNPTFSIWDMSVKTSPQLLVRVAVPASGYVHNIWPTRDGDYVVTTEETSNKTVKVWDISDLNSVSLVGQYLAPSDLAHNAQVQGDTVYISHYESGVRVVDITDPTLPTEIAAYDTYAGESPNFAGCWGAFPYTSNGMVYASNMDGTLFILKQGQEVISDSLWIDSVETLPDDKIRLDVHLKNDRPVRQITIPINYGGNNSLGLDSVSTAGLRTEYFERVELIAADPANDRVAYALTTSTLDTLPLLEAGSGPILSLHFNVPPGVDGDPDTVSMAPFGIHKPTVAAQCVSYVPDTTSGQVVVSQSLCCEGIRGNANGDSNDDVNVTDLSFLVDYLFRGGTQPPCPAEANANSDIFEEVTVADITFLVDYLFRGGAAPGICP